MTYKSHVAFALVIATPISALLVNMQIIPSPGLFVAFFLTIVISTLAPDLDHDKSVLSQILPWLSKFICRYTEHRGFTHKPIAVITSTLIIYALSYKIPLLATAWFIGYSLHIIADGMTISGIQNFYKNNTFYSIPKSFRFRSGNSVDSFIFNFNIVFLILIIYLINNYNLITFVNL